MFYSLTPGGEPDEKSLHASCPTLKGVSELGRGTVSCVLLALQGRGGCSHKSRRLGSMQARSRAQPLAHSSVQYPSLFRKSGAPPSGSTCQASGRAQVRVRGCCLLHVHTAAQWRPLQRCQLPAAGARRRAARQHAPTLLSADPVYNLPARIQPLAEVQKAKWGGCVDQSEHCAAWAATGECERNAGYMRASCKLSCKLCKLDDGAAAAAPAA